MSLPEFVSGRPWCNLYPFPAERKASQEPLNRLWCCSASCLPTLQDFLQPYVNIAPVTVMSNTQCVNTLAREYTNTQNYLHTCISVSALMSRSNCAMLEMVTCWRYAVPSETLKRCTPIPFIPCHTSLKWCFILCTRALLTLSLFSFASNCFLSVLKTRFWMVSGAGMMSGLELASFGGFDNSPCCVRH